MWRFRCGKCVRRRRSAAVCIQSESRQHSIWRADIPASDGANAILAPFSQVYILVLGVYYKLQALLYQGFRGVVQGMRPLIVTITVQASRRG